MKTKAIVFTAPRQAALVEEVLPAPEDGQVLVQNTVTLVSTGTESFCFRGAFDEGTGWFAWVRHPFRPGYSAVGRVVAVGAPSCGVAPGDRVFTASHHATHALVGAADVLTVPPAVSDEEAAWSALSYITQTAVRRAEHVMGDSAAVVGLGPLGQLVTQYLHVLGLSRILAIDTVPARLETAARHGATATFCGSAADAVDFVRQQNEGERVDVVYDVTGHWAVFPMVLGLVRDFGRVVLLGDSPYPSQQHLTHDVLTRQLTIVGTHNAKLQPQYAAWTRWRQVRLFHTYLAQRRMDVAALITHRHRPEEASAVYARLQEDRSDTLGVLFEWGA